MNCVTPSTLPATKKLPQFFPPSAKSVPGSGTYCPGRSLSSSSRAPTAPYMLMNGASTLPRKVAGLPGTIGKYSGPLIRTGV